MIAGRLDRQIQNTSFGAVSQHPIFLNNYTPQRDLQPPIVDKIV
jgi:hypothetical protein